jgi:hypothetical protein
MSNLDQSREEQDHRHHKSSSLVLDQLKSLLAKHPSRKISMVDNIMPHEYFNSLLPSFRGIVVERKTRVDEKAHQPLRPFEHVTCRRNRTDEDAESAVTRLIRGRDPEPEDSSADRDQRGLS